MIGLALSLSRRVALRRFLPSIVSPNVLAGGVSTVKWQRHITSSYLQARVDDPPPKGEVEFQKAKCKGEMLMHGMMASDKDAGKLIAGGGDSAQSKWTKVQDLYDWGYLKEDIYLEEYEDILLEIKPTLKSLGIPSREDVRNKVYRWQHAGLTTEHDGKKYHPTEADNFALFNKESGIIIVFSAYSPAYAGPRNEFPVHEVPELKFWSDVTYIQWHAVLDGKNDGNLRYVLEPICNNPTTVAVVARALERVKMDLSKWPGVDISMESDEGKAILGTPNGYGVGFLLFQHKKQLGNKIVDKVTVFTDDGNCQPRPPSLLFHLRDYTPKAGEGS